MEFLKLSYEEFLKSKVRLAESTGFTIDESEINPALKAHNKLMVKWMVEGGRRACFASFGLHKTVTQLETVRIVLTKTGGRGLIIAPLGVRAEFKNDAINLLGWKEQCKDGSKMGVGMPEYLLLFRKPPSDNSNAYSDIPVLKTKDRYTRARWQFDAHGFTRSSGDRLLDSAEIATLAHDAIYKIFKDFSLQEIWDFEKVVKIGENLEAAGKLPPGFMLCQPQSWTEEVWTDITRMLTLNGSQWSMGKEMHICPMQFDIADRVIEQMSNEGDIVLDYFGGLMTVPYRAILQKRYGYGIELSPEYFTDGAHYCQAAEYKMSVPTLFDIINTKVEESAA